MKKPRFLTPKTALIALGGYAALCGLVYLRQQTILYRPAKPNRQTPPAQTIIEEDARGPELRGWVDNPGKELALVYFGGASEPIELRRDDLAKAFPHHTRYMVPYRGFGPNCHLRPDEGNIKEDALRLVQHVETQYRGIHIIGRSLGTGMAIHVAARIPVMAVGLITPYDSILEVAKGNYKWLPVTRLLRDRFESWRDASKVTAPILTCLAEIDKVVPPKRTEALLRHLPSQPICCTIAGSNHRTIAQCDDLWQRLSGFFAKDVELVLAKPKAEETSRRPRRIGR
jgi:pimeloyl-ACP methyl ester carboxylesterase